MHKECNKSVVTQLTRAHIGYIGSVVHKASSLDSRPILIGLESRLVIAKHEGMLRRGTCNN